MDRHREDLQCPGDLFPVTFTDNGNYASAKLAKTKSNPNPNANPNHTTEQHTQKRPPEFMYWLVALLLYFWCTRTISRIK